LDRKILENTEKGLVIRIRIIPNSSKNELVWENNALKIKIMAQPVENKANKALIEFLAKTLKTAKSNITILKGEINKEKTLLIQGINDEEFKLKFKQ
jgi:uncharacterized protein